MIHTGNVKNAVDFIRKWLDDIPISRYNLCGFVDSTHTSTSVKKVVRSHENGDVVNHHLISGDLGDNF